MEKKILNDFCFHKPKTLDEALVLIDKYQNKQNNLQYHVHSVSRCGRLLVFGRRNYFT